MDIMSRPYLGLWDKDSGLAQKLNHIELRFPASEGDNNYEDAPEDSFYY